MMIHVKHLRAVGICNREPRIWCKQQGISWSQFVTEGLPEEVLIDTGDPMALKVVAAAHQAEGDVER